MRATDEVHRWGKAEEPRGECLFFAGFPIRNTYGGIDHLEQFFQSYQIDPMPRQEPGIPMHLMNGVGVNVHERPKRIHGIDLIKGIQESGLLIDG